MTRINLVDPSVLTDKHLLAEYRELPRIFTAVRKLYDSGKTLEDVEIPDKYVLGKGHCKFFYNKLYYLKNRFIELGCKIAARGFNYNDDLYCSIIDDAEKLIEKLKADIVPYEPTPEEIYLNMARLAKRSKIEEVLNELNSGD